VRTRHAIARRASKNNLMVRAWNALLTVSAQEIRQRASRRARHTRQMKSAHQLLPHACAKRAFTLAHLGLLASSAQRAPSAKEAMLIKTRPCVRLNPFRRLARRASLTAPAILGFMGLPQTVRCVVRTTTASLVVAGWLAPSIHPQERALLLARAN